MERKTKIRERERERKKKEKYFEATTSMKENNLTLPKEPSSVVYRSPMNQDGKKMQRTLSTENVYMKYRFNSALKWINNLFILNTVH